MRCTAIAARMAQICGEKDLAVHFNEKAESIKAGIMEVADLYIINKADLPGAPQAAAGAASTTAAGHAWPGQRRRVPRSRRCFHGRDVHAAAPPEDAVSAAYITQ